MDRNWKGNIYNSIKDFSDINKQKGVWLGSDINHVSSFDEDVCLLFDSFCFDEFIEEFNNETIDKNLLNELRLFRNSLNNYQRKDSDEEILSDELWLAVVNKAKGIVEIWE
jgi:hypothetical protein